MGRICDFTKKKKLINDILKKSPRCFIFSDRTLLNIHHFSHYNEVIHWNAVLCDFNVLKSEKICLYVIKKYIAYEKYFYRQLI